MSEVRLNIFLSNAIQCRSIAKPNVWESFKFRCYKGNRTVSFPMLNIRIARCLYLWIEKKFSLKWSKHEIIIARQYKIWSGVLDFPESYWPMICFVQRIVFPNNWETKKLNIATANGLNISYEMKTCSIAFSDIIVLMMQL